MRRKKILLHAAWSDAANLLISEPLKDFPEMLGEIVKE